MAAVQTLPRTVVATVLEPHEGFEKGQQVQINRVNSNCTKLGVEGKRVFVPANNIDSGALQQIVRLHAGAEETN